MEDLLEKYEQLYFSALEESLTSGKQDIAATLKTLKLNLRLQRALCQRLELLTSTSTEASSTSSEASTEWTCECGEVNAGPDCKRCAKNRPLPKDRTIGFTVTETIEQWPGGHPNPEAVRQLELRPPCPACGPGPCTPSCPERLWRYAKDLSRQFNPPLRIPVESPDGNVHVFEGAYIKSVERTYPEGSPIVEEPVQMSPSGVHPGFEPGPAPGPEVLGNEEYDRRQIDKVMTAVKAISTWRLEALIEEDERRPRSSVLDPGERCWVKFAIAERDRRRDAIAQGRPGDWVNYE